jgi:hypothetical protein
MTIRSFWFLILLACCAGSGCEQKNESPQPSDAKGDQAPQPSQVPVAPAPREKAGRENWPKLLFGKWRQVKPRYAAEITVEYTANGLKIRRSEDIEGVRTQSTPYELVDGTFVFPEPKVEDNVFTRRETTERTTYIESLSEDTLVTVTIVRRRWTVAWAEETAKRRKIPVEQLLSEVREERGTDTFERIKK